MMLWYQALILGAVQGLTEFLPISSSGHLVVLPQLLNWEAQPLVFDLILHLGTATALIVYFRHDLVKIVKSLFIELEDEKKDSKKYTYESKLALFIILGSLPAMLAGLFLEDIIEDTFRGILSVALLLLAGSLFMLYAELRYSKREFHGDITGVKALIIGLFQALALFPGVSRSGSTISGGMIAGLHREYAARFSFLLSIPIVVGAAIFKIADASDAELALVGLTSVLIGFASSFIVGYLAIDLLLRFLKQRSLYIFILYRILLALFLIYFYFKL